MIVLKVHVILYVSTLVSTFYLFYREDNQNEDRSEGG